MASLPRSKSSTPRLRADFHSRPAIFALLVLALLALAGLLIGAATQSGSSEQIVAIKASRSVVAEAALAAELGSSGDATQTFTAELIEEAEDQLRSNLESVEGNERAASLIGAALAELPLWNAGTLRRIADQLLTTEHGE
jgi:hypothetical protein